jgi:hypothetical protein
MAERSTPARAVHIALVHWPVYDRAGSIVATNITNFDIHDIARAARTYGVEKYYIVHRMQEQLMFVSRVLDHWQVGTGAALNPKRKSALGMIETVETVDALIESFAAKPLVIGTTAKAGADALTFRDTRRLIWHEPGAPLLILFGTGNGLHEDVIRRCDGVLESIRGASADDYRHLSVRSAVSICLDRLLGAC